MKGTATTLVHRFRLDGFRLGGVALALCIIAVRSSLAASLDKNMTLEFC